METQESEKPAKQFHHLATRCGYRRQSSLERLVEQARSRHYSAFSLYDQDAFEKALAVFREKVQRRFANTVEWHDENFLVHALRDND